MVANTLYPRTISIRRPNVSKNGATPSAPAVGDVGYFGDDPVDETVILSNLPANISYKGRGYSLSAGLPTDTKGSRWVVTIPAANAPLGSIRPNDVVVDDIGLRYRIDGPDYQILGYELQVELLVI